MHGGTNGGGGVGSGEIAQAKALVGEVARTEIAQAQAFKGEVAPVGTCPTPTNLQC